MSRETSKWFLENWWNADSIYKNFGIILGTIRESVNVSEILMKKNHNYFLPSHVVEEWYCV